MGFVRYATINGERVDVTNVTIHAERTCDRCGRYMDTWTIVTADHNLIPDAHSDISADLCAQCVRGHFPGLIDLAVKVAGSA